MCTEHSSNKKTDSTNKTAHDQEHATWNRRSFIQALGLAGAGSMVLGGSNVSATAPSPLSVALSQAENDNILVIIRLKGGNDGLNTIVPVYNYDTYANLRPTIKHQQSDLLMLNDDFGIPNYMNPLESVWGEGSMKIIHGVGYPEQNLSHFRSSEIWASTQADSFEPTGWWGRYFEDLYPDYLINPPAVPPAIQIGSIGNLIFEGTDNNYAFSVANPNQLANVAENGSLHDVINIPDCVYGDKLLFMRATANTTFTYAGVINDAYMASTNNAPYTTQPLSDQLAIIARMIKGGLGTKVYMVSLETFDTHANQVENHETLLADLALSIKNFYTDLATAGYDDKVLSMTISEFGRRPYENGSNGTDHGAASPTMLFGAGLNGSGFVGDHPNINSSAWDNNDNLVPSTDFRDVYSTVLTDWFCLDPSVVNTILLNETYDNLDLGFNCEALGTQDFNNISTLFHIPTYRNNSTFIEITMTNSARVDIKLYNILGKEIATLSNEIFYPGTHVVDVKLKANQNLAYGQYIYRIHTGGQFYSKSILIK
ncbi:hypothetical protein ULMA_05810 [Patiriisocius marinus]|uniref:Twin-arginine translocation pathway signal n=1 Tax=Patiriisocius marinus TaxID=1397112 RepID=A0A5J4IYF2_9FLAO|nr:DUF1501 domain-containing protein [Patiriisocius marinus]GER58473.1 hypothetical protein ULMA_05810 [Patiriisocius marinus]